MRIINQVFDFCFVGRKDEKRELSQMSKKQRLNSPTNKMEIPATPPTKKSENDHFPVDTTAATDSLAQRVAALEKWKGGLDLSRELLQTTKDRLLQLEIQTGLAPLEVLFPPPKEEECKPGPRRRIPLPKLLECRDRLLDSFEAHWDEIADSLIRAANEQQIRDALFPVIYRDWHGVKALLDERIPALIDIGTKSNLLQTRAPFKRVLKAIETNDEKKWRWFNALPSRKLANALAGVPIYSWKSSYDICRRNPSQHDLHARFYDYIITKLNIHRRES